jgi:hypothetical protein
MHFGTNHSMDEGMTGSGGDLGRSGVVFGPGSRGGGSVVCKDVLPTTTPSLRIYCVIAIVPQ